MPHSHLRHVYKKIFFPIFRTVLALFSFSVWKKVLIRDKIVLKNLNRISRWFQNSRKKCKKFTTKRYQRKRRKLAVNPFLLIIIKLAVLLLCLCKDFVNFHQIWISLKSCVFFIYFKNFERPFRTFYQPQAGKTSPFSPQK